MIVHSRYFYGRLLGVFACLFGFCLSACAACYEPFADASAGGGTKYLPGEFLFGQRAANGETWFPVTNTPAPPATGLPRIVAGSLAYPGLPASTGNSVFIPPELGVMGRMTLNFPVKRGAVYFSFLLKVTDLTGLNDTGTEDNYFAAFGDNVGPQNAALLRAATRVLSKRSGHGFQLGVARNSNDPAHWVFDTTERATNEVLFVVGSYDYGEHAANLWIDPPATTFAGSHPPPPTVSARQSRDLNRDGVRSFVLGCRTNRPPGCLVSALRIGQSWSFVTGGKDREEKPAPAPVASVHHAVEDFHLYIKDPAVLASRPNIIFILCDDLGYGDLGVLFQNHRAPGLPRETTPHLDSFAREGMQLREHYCPAPVCAPSRASLLLGVHQGHANVRDQQFDKALEDNHTLASVMQAAGYATAAIGKWGLGGDDEGGATPAEWPAYPTRRGFDYFFGYERHGDGHEHYPKEAVYANRSKQCYDGTVNITKELDKCYTTDLFTARAKKWIIDQRKNRPDQPFFLYLAFDTPHSVYELPTQAFPAGGGLNGGLQWLGTPGRMINTASGQVDSYIYPEYAGATHQGAPWPEVFQRFASAVRRIDDAVGDVEKLLEDLKIETNTLVIFTSDNGPTIEDALHLKRHYAANFFDNFGPMDGIKRDSFEGGIRMPTLARWPGVIAAGSTNFTPSQFHDWMPTFTELAGLPAPAKTDGVSLVPALTGRGDQRASTVYVEYFDPSSTPNYTEFEPAHRKRLRNQMQVIGLQGYQGVRYDIGSQKDDFEIYDVLHDPKEATNLASNPAMAALQREMKERVLQLRRPNDTAPRPYDDELVPPSRPQSVTNGAVDYAIYEGTWPWVPDADMLTNAVRGHCAGLDPSPQPGAANYLVDYHGYIRITAAGSYTFYLNDDAGAVFRLHEATVIDDDYNHSGAEASGSILLQPGLHAFRLTYRHRTGPCVLNLKYAGAGQAKTAVPLAAFYADSSGGSVPHTVNNNIAAAPATRPTKTEMPRNLPVVAWNLGQLDSAGSLLVQAGPVHLDVTGHWLHPAATARDAQWQPLAGTFADNGQTLRLGNLFEGNIENVRIYNHAAGASELAALLGGTDPAALDWQHRYFDSAPDDWIADEDADGALLWHDSAGGAGPFVADSPTLQLLSRLSVEHPQICYYRRIVNGDSARCEVQASTDLRHWTPLAGREIAVKPSTDLPGFEEIIYRAADTTPATEPLYVRVEPL